MFAVTVNVEDEPAMMEDGSAVRRTVVFEFPDPPSQPHPASVIRQQAVRTGTEAGRMRAESLRASGVSKMFFLPAARAGPRQAMCPG